MANKLNGRKCKIFFSKIKIKLYIYSFLIKNCGDFTAVNNISLRIEQGEIFGLLGPNGAGKSTIVSMISTILFSLHLEKSKWTIRFWERVLAKSKNNGCYCSTRFSAVPTINC
ncbi:ATP-binding cassette domain-containing protein [Paenibacillus larvae]|nr:ATP-binding cassette domain-containing protein [Paenibacillus larvae]